jgi:hypothetical protein
MRRRKRFQYTLRTLMLIVTACAITCSGVAIWVNRATRQREAVDEIIALGGAVYYHSQRDDERPDLPPEMRSRPERGNDLWSGVRAVVFRKSEANDRALSLLADLPGMRNVMITGPNAMTDDGFAHIGKLTTLTGFYVRDVRITDEGFAHLGKVTNLKSLQMYNVRVSDAGLAHLESLTNLEALELEGVAITDAAMVHLRPLCKLTWLTICDAPITDEGLVNLEGLDDLQCVRVPNTRVSSVGAERLTKRLPGCTVVLRWNE